eukprot:gene18626-22810_t
MNFNFEQVHNYYERLVFEEVVRRSQAYPDFSNDMLADVSCVALNRLPPRYIRHEVDFSFYLTEHERLEIDNAIVEAVSYAFNFVQARTALRSPAAPLADQHRREAHGQRLRVVAAVVQAAAFVAHQGGAHDEFGAVHQVAQLQQVARDAEAAVVVVDLALQQRDAVQGPLQPLGGAHDAD